MTGGAAIVALLALGAALVVAVLVARLIDQRARDTRRVIVTLGFPRGLDAVQLAAVVRTAIGMGRTASGLTGRDTIVFEAVGTSREIVHRMRVPQAAADNLYAQVRATVPGVRITVVENFQPERLVVAQELRRAVSDADLVTKDVAGASRAVIAALSGLHSGEQAVWQLVVSGGVSARPVAASTWQLLTTGTPEPRRRPDGGIVSATLRIGTNARSRGRAEELLARLRHAAGTLSAPGARLTPRLLPAEVVTHRMRQGATSLTASPTLLTPDEVAAVLAWPVGDPLVAGLNLGGSPQLPAPVSVPRSGRVLGRSTVDDRPVAQPLQGAAEHTVILGPTGSGKTHLAVRLFLGDVAAGRGGLVLDPKGGFARSVLDRLPEEAASRTVVIDPTDEGRPVPLPLLAAEGRGIPELAADTLVGLLRHQHRDLGPRSTDILTSSLYALARTPNATLMDLLRLWSDASYRATVAGRVAGDPVLASFLAWFEALSVAERGFVLAPPLNKIRPLLQRAAVRNVIAAPRATFSFGQAIREGLVVIAHLPEGRLGTSATTLIGQVILARMWTAVQASRTGRPFNVTVDEAPRFLDQPTDLGDVLARSREYGVGLTLVAQSLSQLPNDLREITMNSARTKIAFGTSQADGRRLAAEFGPGVEPDYFSGLDRYEAIAAVSLGGTVSTPFTFRAEALDEPTRGRAGEVRRASRQRFGVDRTEIEAAIVRSTKGSDEPTGIVGRRRT